MTDIIKPPFPPVEPEGYHKYLASAGLTSEELLNSCVKEGRVVGIDSLTSVRILCDGDYYDDVPVWVHTDAGARTSAYRDTTTGTSPDVAATGYFKNAALMFPLPGCTGNGSYGSAITFNDLGGGQVDFDSDLFDITTDQGRTFPAEIVLSMTGSKATIKSAYVEVNYIGTPQQEVVVNGTTIESYEYILTGEAVDIFVEDVGAVPVECVTAFSGDTVAFCDSVLYKHLEFPALTTIDEVKIALGIDASPKVMAIISTDSDGVKTALGVIGIVSNTVATGFSSSGPWPTYRMFVKMEIQANDTGQPGYGLAQIYVYDVLNATMAQVPSRGVDGAPILPFIDAGGVLDNTVTQNPQLLAEYTAAERAAEDIKRSAINIFLSRGFIVGNDLVRDNASIYGDLTSYSGTGRDEDDYYCIPYGVGGFTHPGADVFYDAGSVPSLTVDYYCYGGEIRYYGDYRTKDFPVMADSLPANSFNQVSSPYTVTTTLDPLDTAAGITFYAEQSNGWVSSLVSDVHYTFSRTTSDGGTPDPGDYQDDVITITENGASTFTNTIVRDGVATEYTKSFSGSHVGVYTGTLYGGGTEVHTYSYNDTCLHEVQLGGRNFICDASMFGLGVVHYTWGFPPVVFGDISAELLGDTTFGSTAYLTTSTMQEDLTAALVTEMEHLQYQGLNHYGTTYALIRFRIYTEFTIYMVPFDIEEELLND